MHQMNNELPLNHSFMNLLPLWHQFPKASHPSVVEAEVEVEDRMTDVDRTEEGALELDRLSRSDL
jgi:hypothetical protein